MVPQRRNVVTWRKCSRVPGVGVSGGLVIAASSLRASAWCLRDGSNHMLKMIN
jgi:hypothetical protein